MFVKMYKIFVDKDWKKQENFCFEIDFLQGQ